MSAHFTLTLDTNAPVITWGTPSTTTPGEMLVLPYTIDEPGIFSVQFRDQSNNIYPANFDGVNVNGVLPNSPGNVYVEALVLDDVDNSALRTFTLNLIGIGDEIPQGGGGGPGAFTKGGGAVPLFHRDIVEIESAFSLPGRKEISIPGQFTLRRRNSIELSGEYGTVRRNTLSFEMQRGPAEHYLQLSEEDELLLIL